VGLNLGILLCVEKNVGSESLHAKLGSYGVGRYPKHSVWVRRKVKARRILTHLAKDSQEDQRIWPADLDH
jgi:hypothetical protein